DSTYSYNHLTAYPSGHPASPKPSFYAQGDTWYTFTGTGETLLLDNFSTGTSIGSTLLKGNCNEYEVIPSDYFAGETAYQTEPGVIYYLQILASNTITQKFILRPLTLADNDECSGARLYEL